MPERVAFDASALLGPSSRELAASSRLKFVDGFWSTWIAAEVVRTRTEWAAEESIRAGHDRSAHRRTMRQPSVRINTCMHYLNISLTSVDFAHIPTEHLSWLRDRDDWPIMQTALAAGASVLATENTRDSPVGETRNGILMKDPQRFLATLYAQRPDARGLIEQYLAER